MGYTSYETPDDVFRAVNEEFRFDVDVCAVPDNAKCARFFTPEQNGLAQDWRGVCWCNPPFDRTKPAWVKKAYESAQAGATVVVLLPWNGTGDTSWWHKYVLRASEIRYLRGRQRYSGLDGRKVTVRTVLVVFRPYCEGPPVALSCKDTGTLFPNTSHQPPPNGGRLDGVVGPLN